MRSSEVTLIGGASGRLEFLTAGFADRSAQKEVNLFLLDRQQGMLTVLDWLPGSGLSARSVRLDGTLPGEPLLGSVAGSIVAVSGHEGVRLVEHETGAVQTVAGLQHPAVISPNGRRLISVTDRGLLTMDLWRGEAGTPPFASGIEPLALAAFDSPHDMHILPGEGGEDFAVVVGCYGAVGHAAISGITSSWPETRIRNFSTTPLPYDPVHFATPGPIAATAERQFVYACDDGHSGVLAINAKQSETYPCPLGVPHNYAVVGHVKPSLDSMDCLVRLRTGGTLLWHPGTEPHAIDLPGRLPLAWHDGYALMPAGDGATMREVPLPW